MDEYQVPPELIASRALYEELDEAERLAWERHDKAERRRPARKRQNGASEILNEIVPTAQILHVDAPNYEAARSLLL